MFYYTINYLYNFSKKNNSMYSFLICFISLIASYFIYGKVIEKIAGVDENIPTPVHRLEDGVDYSQCQHSRHF